MTYACFSVDVVCGGEQRKTRITERLENEIDGQSQIGRAGLCPVHGSLLCTKCGVAGALIHDDMLDDLRVRLNSTASERLDFEWL